jgi:sodium-dependent dicarboxylate transporter 2/3/5
MASTLHFLSNLPLLGTSLFFSAFTARLNNLLTHTATATVFVTMLADKCNMNNICSALMASLSCSYAFMLPVATAPKAIVKQAGDIPVSFVIQVRLDRGQ